MLRIPSAKKCDFFDAEEHNFPIIPIERREFRKNPKNRKTLLDPTVNLGCLGIKWRL
jgi:hypothetical protein